MTKAASSEKEEVYVYLTPESFRKRNEEACLNRLKECMSADKLEPTLENGFVEDNIEQFYNLRTALGRRRNFSYYYSKPYTPETAFKNSLKIKKKY